VVVVMEYELALKLLQLDVLTVIRRADVRLISVPKTWDELVGDVDFIHGRLR